MTSPINKVLEKETTVVKAAVVPEFDQYINVVLTKENYEVVKEAVTKHPDKLEKIMQYVNSPVFKQDQLKEVFNRSVF
jgi:hypothetical protein